MAEEDNSPEGTQVSPAPEVASEATSQAAPSQPSTQQTVELDDSATVAGYANFCRVTGTPEAIAFR